MFENPAKSLILQNTVSIFGNEKKVRLFLWFSNIYVKIIKNQSSVGIGIRTESLRTCVIILTNDHKESKNVSSAVYMNMRPPVNGFRHSKNMNSMWQQKFGL